MAHLDTIKEFLDRNKKKFCDDCLSELLGITPRQNINSVCNKNQNIIIKQKNSKCDNCGESPRIVRFTK